MRGGKFDISTLWRLLAGGPHLFRRGDRVPRTGQISDWHVDRAQVHGRVVADRTGKARIPGPIVISESSQYLHEGLAVNDVEAQRSYARGSNPCSGEPGNPSPSRLSTGPR